jgi:hypothetical protein
MTNEPEAIAKALAQWLVSQEVSPMDGIPAMAALIGEVLGKISPNIGELLQGLSRTNGLITNAAMVVHLNKVGAINLYGEPGDDT